MTMGDWAIKPQLNQSMDVNHSDPFSFLQKFCQEEKSRGVMSSLVSWVTSGVTLPSFIEKYSYPECSWLMFMLLTIENQYERDTTLWASMQDELLDNPKMGVDQALKVKKFKLLN